MLRIMTTNLRLGRADAGSLARVLERTRPDVVGAQELGPVQAEVLESHFGFGVVKPDTEGEGRALVANRSISVSVLDLADRDGLHGNLEIDGVDIEVMVAHLWNPLDPFVGKAPFRRAQVRALCGHLDAGSGPRVLVGDMNASPAWPAYRVLRKRLDDAIADHTRRMGGRAARTWSRTADSRPLLRIDHVLTDGLRAENVEVVPIVGTDHRAVIVDLVSA